MECRIPSESTNETLDGKYRKIKVDLLAPDGGPLTVLEIPAGSPGNVKIAVISEAGGQGRPDTSPVPFKLNVYWSVGKPPAGSGQESGSSPQGGSGAPHAPKPSRGETPAPSGGDEGGGDVGQGP